MGPFGRKIQREIQFWKNIATFFALWSKQRHSPDWQRIKTESYIETRLYDALCKKGFHVKTQYPIAGYAVDLVIKRYRLAIECDGAAFHQTPKQKKLDAKKTRVLQKYGWKVVRLSGREINNHLERAVDRVVKRIGRE